MSTTVQTGWIVTIPWVAMNAHVRRDTTLVWEPKRNAKVTKSACMHAFKVE